MRLPISRRNSASRCSIAESTRQKPQLTEAGRTVLSEARTVSNRINGLRAKVKGLLQGLEAEIDVVLDVMLPAWRVVDALKAFRVEFPTVSLRLYTEALGAVTQMVLDRNATIGVCGPLDVEVRRARAHRGRQRRAPIPVAAPDHPLARGGRNAPGSGRDHIQLVLTDRSPLTRGQDNGVIGTQTWRLADLGSKHMLLKEGIGWGFMPEPMVREDITAGRLVQLDMTEYNDGFIMMGSSDCTRSTEPIHHRARRHLDHERFMAQAPGLLERLTQRTRALAEALSSAKISSDS